MIIKKRPDPLRILFPRRCPLCDGLLGMQETCICRSCEDTSVPSFYPFPGGFAPFPYEGKYRESVKRFKYSGRAEYAEYFARAILEAGEDEIRRHEPDCLVPVPVHRLRYRERGYNQAEELAKELSKLLGIPCRSRLLIRIRNTVPQNPLLPEERRENVKNAFSLREADIRKKSVPKRILLVDDICTTGATLEAAASVLYRCGAAEIRAVCATAAHYTRQPGNSA